MIVHLSPTLGGLGCDFTLVSHLFSRLTQNMLLLDLCQLSCIAAALDSFTSVWGQRWYIFFEKPVHAGEHAMGHGQAGAYGQLSLNPVSPGDYPD